MKKATINVYSFDELNEDAKLKAIANLAYVNVEHDWYEFIYDKFKPYLQDNGFEVINIYFSGFSSHGDGAMFEYKISDQSLLHCIVDQYLILPQWKKNILKNGYISGKGKQSGNYYHENSCSHSIYIETDNGMQYYQNIEDLFYEHHSEIEDHIIERYKNLCRKLYKALEKEYEYLTSEEAIIETIEANNYEFTEDGKLY